MRCLFFFSSRRRHTRSKRDWSSDVCSSDLSAGLMLVVNPATPVANLREFIGWTKSYKGALNFGSAGIGTGGHLAGELYKVMTGVKAEHIPYKGAGPALMDLIA